MKKTIAVLLVLMMILTLLAACGKKTQPQPVTETGPNAVLTDSDVPLDIGAEVGNADPAGNGALIEAEEILIE